MDQFERVKDIIVSTLGCDESDVTMEAVITDDLGADSLSMVELVMALEDIYNISLPEEAVANIRTVGDIVEYIGGKD